MSEQDKAWIVALRSVSNEELEIAVYDVIGQSMFGDGIVAKDVLAKLRATPNAKKISLRVNSVGGVVDEAKAMVNLLAERKSNGVAIEATVDGIAASSASYLLTAASKVVMPENAFQMIHGVRSRLSGTAADMEARGALMRRMNDHLADAYAAASARRGKGKTKEQFLAAFAAGDLYLDADESIAWGLADEKVGALQVAACLADVEGLEGAPDALLKAPYVTHVVAMAPPAQTPAPAANDVAPVTKLAPRATGQRTIPMTKSEIKAQFPEVFAAIFEEGKAEGKAEGKVEATAAERKRVGAHLKMAETCNAMDVAKQAIASGVGLMDDDVIAEYQTSAIKKRAIGDRQADSDTAGAVVAGANAAAAVEAVKDLGDEVADRICGVKKAS